MSARRRQPRRIVFTWDEALDSYLLHLRALRASARTISGHRYDLLALSDYLRKQDAAATPAEVTLAHLRGYQVALLTGSGARRGKPLSAGAVARVTSAVRRFFAFLTDEKLLAADPAARLDPPQVPRRAPGQVLTPAEVKRLLQAAPPTPLGLRDKALVDLLASTGLRRCEVCALDLGDLDHAERQVVVRAGKGEKGRIVPVTRSAYLTVMDYLERARPALLSSHPDSGRALFLTKAGRRLHFVALLRALRGLRQAAGLSKSLTPHCLRRTFATCLLKNGVSLKVIQELLGHADLATTSVYLRLDTRELRREILLKHPRERFEA